METSKRDSLTSFSPNLAKNRVQFHDILSTLFRDILYTPARAKLARSVGTDAIQRHGCSRAKSAVRGSCGTEEEAIPDLVQGIWSVGSDRSALGQALSGARNRWDCGAEPATASPEKSAPSTGEYRRQRPKLQFQNRMRYPSQTATSARRLFLTTTASAL